MMQSRQLSTKQIYACQSGATLLVALMFLLMMTMFAISSVNMSTVNLKIIGNMQSTKALDSTARDAVEQLIGTADTFVETPTNSITVTEYNPTTATTNATAVPVGGTATTPLGTVVSISDPECVDSQIATGYTAVTTNIIPDDNTWEVIVTLRDPVTGAESITHQGAQIRMLAGNCPD